MTAAAFLFGGILPASAARVAVDDSATVVVSQEPTRWLRPAAGRVSRVRSTAQVRIVLNVSAWQGKPVRIYMTLPVQPSSGMRATWTTQGGLLAGGLTPGGQALIFQGTVHSPRIVELISMAIESDGTQLSSPQPLHFGVELESAS